MREKKNAGRCIDKRAKARIVAHTMDSYENPFVVAETSDETQATFYRKTYGLVALSFLAWAVTLGGLFLVGAAEPLANLMFGSGRLGWLVVLGLFWAATSWAQSLAFSRSSSLTQYMGLALYIVAEVVIFVPLMVVVAQQTNGDVGEILAPAGIFSGLLIAALTATVFMTRINFSFLRTAVVLGSFFALGCIVCFSIFGNSPGMWFAVVMIVLMSAAILWQTGKVKDSCAPDQHVGAAVLLFAGFMTLLWYVIQLFLSRRS